MTFTEAVRTVLSKYFVIEGRARRSEYWWFALFNGLGTFLAGLIDSLVLGFHGDFSPLSSLFGLALLIPSITVAIRRLHDRDMSGWWFLLVFLPFVGWLALLVLYCLPGTEGTNRFGPDPIRSRDDSRRSPPDDNDDIRYTPSSIPKVDRD